MRIDSKATEAIAKDLHVSARGIASSTSNLGWSLAMSNFDCAVKRYERVIAAIHVGRACPLPTGRRLRKCQMRRIHARRRAERRRWL